MDEKFFATGKRLTILLRYAAGLILLIGCLAASPAAAAEHTMNDLETGLAVEKELSHDGSIPHYLIDATVVEGVVTLRGEVDNLLAKERAGRLAETVKGVRAVINDVTVRPARKRNDSEIRQDIVTALRNDPVIEASEVDVEVEAGHVTLSGTLDSYQEGLFAGRTAKSVPGVRALTNALTFRIDSAVSDSEIKTEIERRNQWDVWVTSRSVTITVKDGRVRLGGTVGSAAELRRVRNNAWVAGVKDVNAENLQVDWRLDRERRRKQPPVDVSDSAIQQAVRDAFLYDPRVNSFDITATSKEGVLTLTGVVDNFQAKEAAAEDARNTVGVWRVINHIKVRPADIPEDENLAASVLTSLENNTQVDASEIIVTADHGKVILAGTVDSVVEKDSAARIAGAVQGVVVVENDLSVRQAPPVEKNDWELLEDIESELFWSPFVDADQVNVSVNDGMVFLTGTVDSWRERRNATENAYEAGAERVKNYLKVKEGPAYYQP